MIRSLIRKKFPASRLALSVGLGGSLLALNFASAQQVSDPATSQAPETAAPERVVITGTNIPSSEEVGTAPVDTVDQAARDRTGQEDVLSVLTESTPAISSGGGNLGQSNASISSGSTLGASSVSIHGLPTLVLLNGRRLTDASAAAAGGGSFTDVNLFPSALVKRIEVLKDGASAIYGTEAVGGVINVILDQEFQGFEFSARYGETEAADVQDQRYSAIFGLGDAKTHIVIGAEYVEQQPIFDRERDFSQPAFGTSTYPGIIRLGSAVSGVAGGVTPYVLNPALNSPVGVGVTNPGAASTLATLPAGTYSRSSAGAVTAGFDLSRATTITLDQNRLSVVASGDRQLFDKYVVAFADFLYSSVYTQNYLNAQPISNATGVTIPATAPYNPFGRVINATTLTGANAIQVNNRFISNPRIFRTDADFYRVVAGLKGEIIPNYNYEVAMNSSRDELSFKNFNLINGAALNAAVAGGYNAAGVATPFGAYSLVNGNIQPAVNFFARQQTPGSLVGVFGTDIRYFETKFVGLDGKITAFPVNLPAGPLGVAAGGEWRHESLKANIDPQNFLGSVPIGDIDVGRDVTAGFAEVQIPIIGPDMHIPGVYSLDLDGAGRFEDYDPGNSTWVPKVGFVYRPIKDIALRGTFSKSFIAPTLYETNGPSSSGFTSSINLPNQFGVLQGAEQAQSTGGSNPLLGNERADTYTAGIVISPHQVPGLTLNADFFHVEETNLIGTVGATTILQSVNSLGTASPFVGQVHFGSFTGPTVTGPFQLAGNLPAVFVTANEQNLGGARIGGIDFGAHYGHDFGKFGAINIGIDGTYYLQYKVQTFAFTPMYNIIGFYNGQSSEVADYHLTPTVEYKWQGFTASALMNYTPSVRDASQTSLDPTQGGIDQNKDRYSLSKIRDYYDIDLLFSYEFGLNKPVDAPAPTPTPKDAKDGGKQVVSHDEAKKMMTFHWFDGLKLSFGINNVTNARPPLINNSPDSTNTDAAIYDPYQRRYYFVITKKF